MPLYGTDRFATNPALTERLAAAVRAALPDARLHRGLIASGDRFVSSARESQALQQTLPDALAVEMEGAAVAQVCHDYGVPFAAVRTISDRADDAAPGDYLAFVEKVASRYSAAILDAFLR